MIIEILSWACLLAGGLLGIVGGIGIHRFPDFYSRMHAVGITDTLCAAMFLIGLSLQTGVSIASVKLLLIFVFLFFSSPTATHALANSALLGGIHDHEQAGRVQAEYTEQHNDHKQVVDADDGYGCRSQEGQQGDVNQRVDQSNVRDSLRPVRA